MTCAAEGKTRASVAPGWAARAGRWCSRPRARAGPPRDPARGPSESIGRGTARGRPRGNGRDQAMGAAERPPNGVGSPDTSSTQVCRRPPCAIRRATCSPVTASAKSPGISSLRDTERLSGTSRTVATFTCETQRGAATDKSCHPERPLTLAERRISELSGRVTTENYEDEYRKRPPEGDRTEGGGSGDRSVSRSSPGPPTTDLVATLKASLGRKALAKPPATKSAQESPPAKRPASRRRAP